MNSDNVDVTCNLDKRIFSFFGTGV
jgi:hypothetical protein